MILDGAAALDRPAMLTAIASHGAEVFQIGVVYSLLQVRDALLDLAGGVLQQFPAFVGEGIRTVQSLMDTAVDLRQLLRLKKGAFLKEAGADDEVPLGGVVVFGPVAGAVEVALPERGPVMHPFPGDELGPIPG